MKSSKIDTSFFENLAQKEIELNLYSIKIMGDIPLWRIFRSRARRSLAKKMGYFQRTRVDKIGMYKILVSILKSFVKYLSFFINKNVHVDNIFYAFPRLYKFKDYYIDRLTDPVISQTKIKESFYIFQRIHGGDHFMPRCHSDRIFYLDFVTFFSQFMSVLLLPLLFIVYRKKINKLYKASSTFFQLRKKDLVKWYILLGQFLVSYRLNFLLLKRISPKRIYLVNKVIFYPVIIACKRLKIVVYEIQHGITHGATLLYSGEFDSVIDPDYFLAFGEKCIGPQYGMPVERIINIGWAYKNLLNNELSRDNYHSENAILVISHPNLSNLIVAIIKILAEKFPDYQFHIRPHPQETFSAMHKNIIDEIKNVYIVNNTEESFQTVFKYKTIIGENSTVLYEALALGKKVGRLAFNGFKPWSNDRIFGGTVISSLEDFAFFLNEDNPVNKNCNYYSDFNAELVNNLK